MLLWVSLPRPYSVWTYHEPREMMRLLYSRGSSGNRVMAYLTVYTAENKQPRRPWAGVRQATERPETMTSGCPVAETAWVNLLR